MPDTKITALAAITTVDPVADVLPIVDVSDTSMAASGTTKKITSNQILGAGGTATLASATVTGAVSVGTTLGVTGVSTFAAGTALLPSLTTTGDPNTGIYYPAADTFAVTTGGSERCRVDSSGRFGVGITPSHRFHARDDLSELYFRDNGTASELLINSETGGRSAVYFGDVADIVRGGVVYDSSVDTLSLNGYNNSTRVIIDSSGNVISNVTGSAPALAINSQMVFNLTSNTNLRISVRGTDGVTRTTNLTLS